MIFLLISTLLFAFNSVLWKKNLENVKYLHLTAYRAFFTSFISFAVLIYLGVDWQMIIEIPFLYVSVGSVFGAVGLFSMLHVIKSAPLQWIGLYNLVGVIFTYMYLYLIEDIKVTHSKLGLFFIFLGFVLYLYKHRTGEQNLNIKQHILLTLMVFGFGMASILHWKNLSSLIHPIYILWNQEIVVFLISIPFFWLSKTFDFSPFVFIKAYFFRVIFMSLVIFFALYFSLLGLEATNPIILSVQTLGTPLLTILFGALFFKEKIHIFDIISIVLILTGAFLINFYEF